MTLRRQRARYSRHSRHGRCRACKAGCDTGRQRRPVSQPVHVTALPFAIGGATSWTLREGSDFRLSANGRDPFVARQILLSFSSQWLPPRLAKYGRERFSIRAEIRRLRSTYGWATEQSGALPCLREPPPVRTRRWNCATVRPNDTAGRVAPTPGRTRIGKC